MGRVKLNVDGCSLGNLGAAGVGGVIRDHCGDFLHGFAALLGNTTNNYTECLGLLHGLCLIDSLDLPNVEIDLDSKLVVCWLRNKRCGICYLEDYWYEIQDWKA